jgi:hypothetical protein
MAVLIIFVIFGTMEVQKDKIKKFSNLNAESVYIEKPILSFPKCSLQSY